MFDILPQNLFALAVMMSVVLGGALTSYVCAQRLSAPWNIVGFQIGAFISLGLTLGGQWFYDLFSDQYPNPAKHPLMIFGLAGYSWICLLAGFGCFAEAYNAYRVGRRIALRMRLR